MVRNLMKYEQAVDFESKMSYYIHDIPAGTTYPLHWHDFIEFEIILSGRAKHIYNDEIFTVGVGSAYMMCYYDFHELTAETDVTLFHMHFDKNVLNPKISQLLDYNKFHCHFDKDETQKILHKINELLDESKSDSPFKFIMMENITNELVIAMIRKCSQKEIQPILLPIQQAVSYLNEHFLEKVTLEELARQISFSPDYLGKLFKQQTGSSFNEYLNMMRLKYACNLLRSSTMSIKEISNASGYRSIEYFMYVFKNKMMMTPGEYRKMQKNTDQK